jgi:hypothetical protein
VSAHINFPYSYLYVCRQIPSMNYLSFHITHISCWPFLMSILGYSLFYNVYAYDLQITTSIVCTNYQTN